MDNLIVKRLMMPGNWHWTDAAACADDPRFTGDEPDEDTALELEEKCLGCRAFFDCSLWVAEDKPTQVFAAGSWRD